MGLITREQVLHVAKLARLTLEEHELPTVTSQLENILGHIAQLQELNTDDVPPTAQVGVERIALREDSVIQGLSREAALSNAPEVAASGFVVPAFVDE